MLTKIKNIQGHSLLGSKLLIATCASTLILSGCDDSGRTPPPSEVEVQEGVFLDSAVANIAYRTETQSGRTDVEGRYNYIEGETVTFSIGDLDLPPILAQGVVTPEDLVSGAVDEADPAVVNIARLLQSLDDDGDPSNGIEILDEAHDFAEGHAEVDFDGPDFDLFVEDLVANSGSDTTTLISEEQALEHLQDTLIDLGQMEPRDADGDGVPDDEDAPKADAGADQSINFAETVELTGALSTTNTSGNAENGEVLSYSWELISVPALAENIGLTLNDAGDSVTTSFTAPGGVGGSYVVRLTVTVIDDAEGINTDTDDVTIVVAKDMPGSGSMFGLGLLGLLGFFSRFKKLKSK